MTDLPPPAIPNNVPLVDPKTGMGSAYFLDWLVRQLRALVNATNSNTNTIAALQAAQAAILAQNQQILAAAQAAADAQATADGGGSARSGTATANVNASGSTWVNGPTVNLLTVSAGNLTIATSGPNQINTTTVNPGGPDGIFTGNWRIVEITPGPIETTVFSGTYTGQRLHDDTGTPTILYSNTDTSAVSIPLTTTGTISYRLDINAPGFIVNQVQCFLSVRRS